MPTYALIFISAMVASVVVWLQRSAARRHARERTAAAQATAATAIREAEMAAEAQRNAAATAVRKEVLDIRAQADLELTRSAEAIARREGRLTNRKTQVDTTLAALAQRSEDIDTRRQAVKETRDRAQALRRDAAERRQQARRALEDRAGDSAENVKAALVQRWIETAHAEAAQRVRAIEQDGADPKYDRDARRIMDIAISRYQNHFLTERNISNIPVGSEVCQLLTDNNNAIHEVLQEVANVQLHLNDEGNAVKLDGLDGVGREVARRALNRLVKKGSARTDARADPKAWATTIRDNLEREISALGKRAFGVLKIARAHPDIVQLVGALNYRTSYTQNQWLHAVESSFIAGMMASEMGLDVKLARRATLMHDIGKALTHKIDGSHAVIGADIARKLGEDEIVANAIGAHHADEQPNSLYAYLVAAADAMSGARPGARRETTDIFNHRVEDLERIGISYQGVDRAYAVHGGRELRVYVDESRVDDLDVVELSTEIAEHISEEMSFPGQIKVTVIRAFEANATAN